MKKNIQENFGEFVKSHVYRVIINYSDKQNSCGSGFFIDKKTFLTCCHVVLGSELENIRENEKFKLISGESEHLKLEEFYKAKNAKIEIELLSGEKVEASLKEFNEFYDIATLEVDINEKKVNICEFNLKPILSYGSSLAFGGFSNQFGYKFDEYPFSYNEGIISSFPKTIVAGDSYEHIRINSINLGGNSGAPLFIKGNKKVIGIINGNMNWGRNDLAVYKISGDTNSGLKQDSLRVPLSIAYATLIALIKNKTNILNK